MLYSFDNYTLDIDRRELRKGKSLVSVEPQVLDLLIYLISNRDRVVSKDDIISAIWNGRIVSESAITTRINAARTAIGDSGDLQRFIKTLPRKGLRFVGNVEGPQSDPAASAPVQPQSTVELALPDRPSIAVLPFANLNADPNEDYFADGMAEEIITALSRCHWLFVIARNSSFTYKGKTVDVRRVGQELGVRYVLEGSIRRGGSRLRFMGQLADTATGLQIWADRFEGEPTDVFELQDQFTQSVVAAIEPTLQLAEIARLKHKPASSLDAYDLLLRAQQLEHEFTAESLTSAIECSKGALKIDANYAPAMALTAHCYGECLLQGWMRDVASETAEGARLASRAVELGQDDGNVLWMAARATLHLAKDRDRARALAYKSLEINPNSAVAISIAGLIEAMCANSDTAIQLSERAQRLNPRDPRGWLPSGNIALAHLTEGRFEQAITYCNKILLLNPRWAGCLRVLAASLAYVNRTKEAAEVLRQLEAVEPNLTIAKVRARMSFQHDRVLDRVAEGLRRAGMPE